jgi:acetylornithine deacetylase/succinyl-diaminopimelate desuccinylase-like protein
MWRRPTLEINGMYGGYQGAGAKTIMPSFARAKAFGAARRRTGSRAREARRDEHLQRVAPPGVRVEVEAHGDVRAVETSRDHPAVAAAARAMERGFGKAAGVHRHRRNDRPGLVVRPHPGLPQVLIGVGLPDDAIHAPNEKFDLAGSSTEGSKR